MDSIAHSDSPSEQTLSNRNPSDPIAKTQLLTFTPGSFSILNPYWPSDAKPGLIQLLLPSTI
jgi:hypothetical protein